MLLARRIARLEAAQADRLARMSEAELRAVLDACHGEGAGQYLSDYMDALPNSALAALAAGAEAQAALAWDAFDRWQQEPR